MPKEYGRNRRIAQFIKEELSTLIQKEFPLHQYGMITLTNVDVSPNLKNAVIFFTELNSSYSRQTLTEELNEQAGHFRHEIACAMTSKSVPALRFKYDESIERAQRLTGLIESISRDHNGH